MISTRYRPILLGCLFTYLNLLSVFPQFHYSYEWKIPVFLCIVQTIANYKLIRDVKAAIINSYISDSSLRFVQQCTQTDTVWISLLQNLDEIT